MIARTAPAPDPATALPGGRTLSGARRDPRPTHDTEAYELYLKARQKYEPYAAAADLDEALALARRAAERDPMFAGAHALVAEIQTFRGFWDQGPRDEILAEARQAARTAIAIDPRLAYPHAVSGLATGVLDWKWEAGYREAARATDLDPNDVRSLSLRAVLSLTRGKSSEAVRLAYRAYELAPIDPHALGVLSWVLYQARQYDEAARFMAKTLEADPDAVFARTFRPLALARAGHYDEALAAERTRSAGGTAPGERRNLPLILVLAGRRNEARTLLEQTPPREDAAEAVAVLGETRPLLDRLDELLERHRTEYVMWLRTGPAWDPVRDAPRFRQALTRAGLI